MAKARMADVSEHNGKSFNGLYKLLWAIYRVCDGTYVDQMYRLNDTFARTRKRLLGYFCYSVWPRSVGSCTWQDCFETLKQQLGTHHRRRMVLMDDVESWNRDDLRHDFSAGLEAKRQAEVQWLHSLRPKWQRSKLLRRWYMSRDERRVVGYGNRGDLSLMAGDSTKVKWKFIIIADYTPGVATPRVYKGWKVIARQHTNGVVGDEPHGTPPFNTCDMNVGTSGPVRQARRLGLGHLTWVVK